jgi:hypothetical protein
VHIVAVGVGRLVVWPGIGQARVLGQQRSRVDADAVQAALEPEPQRGFELGPDLRVGPADGLKSTQEAIAAPPTLYPHALHPSSYSRAWGEFSLGRLLLNTLYYAFGALAFQLVFDVAAAYSLSRLRPALGKVILAMMVATLMIPAMVLIIPLYRAVAHLPIVNISLIGSPAAKAAVALLVNQMENVSVYPEELLFEPELVVRGSTGPRS